MGAADLRGQLAPPATGGVVALDQLLQQAAETRRILVIGAHPDDEDTELLALMARGYGARAAYLSLSRGEGGQNLIGNELGVDLGLLRSQELVAARSVDGAEQFFTRAFDFGYSRSLEETSRFWPPDAVLEDVIRVVRRFRPHVIVSVFSGTPRDGHGQHQAAGVAARRAFEVAGDPAVYPALAADEGLAPWTPLKLYQSTRFRADATTLELATGELDPRTGRSYHQLAMASRSRHGSQDMGRVQRIGPADARLQLVADRTGRPLDRSETDPFDGVPADTSWLGREATALRATLAPAALGAAVPRLAAAVRRARAMEVDPARRALLERALSVAAAVIVDATAGAKRLIPGARVEIATQIYNAGRDAVSLDAVEILTPAGWRIDPLGSPPVPLAPGALAECGFAVTPPPDAAPSQPYFLERPLRGALYDWSAAPGAVRGLPFEPPVLRARFHLTIAGAPVALEREVTYRYGDQAVGEVRRPLRVVPRVEVALRPDGVLWPAAGAPRQAFTVTLTHHGAEAVTGTVRLEADGWPPSDAVPFRFEQAGESRTVALALPRPPGTDSADVAVRAVARTDDGRVYDRGLAVVAYPHVRPTVRAVGATGRVRVAPIRFPSVRRVGYLRGAADRVPEALRDLGLPVEPLDAGALAGADLAGFDAVVVGSRAYETDSALTRFNARLLEYVRGGGLLIVQYQQYAFARGGFAPYPLTIGVPHDRVTDEASPVRILHPEHPAVTSPNRLTPDDWNGWPQERGLYFADTWDERYVPILEMRDPGREPVRGGLLVARLGEGTYVYTGISFFRALPDGNPGAFRLFLNLIGLHDDRR